MNGLERGIVLDIPFSYQKMMMYQISVPTELIRSYRKLDLVEQDVIVILQLITLQQQGDLLPSFEFISENMQLSPHEVANILKKLKNNGYLRIEQIEDEQRMVHEWYSLEPLINKLYEGSTSTKEEEKKEEGKLFGLFEQEFGRALSPIEIETVSHWLDQDQFKPALIKAALREAVLMGKMNFRYIDRILAEWKKRGIRSSADMNQTKEPIQEKPKEKRDTSVYYNWLEE